VRAALLMCSMRSVLRSTQPYPELGAADPPSTAPKRFPKGRSALDCLTGQNRIISGFRTRTGSNLPDGAGTIRSARVLLAMETPVMKRLLAAALILSAVGDFASAQTPADDAQDKTRVKPGPYPTEFQIAGTAGETDGAFLLDNKARLFFCAIRVGDTLECTQPVQLPEQVIVDPNHTPRAAKYFMAQNHHPAPGIVIVSNYGMVRRCGASSGAGGLELSCSSPFSLP
jgi:hypothetical protein